MIRKSERERKRENKEKVCVSVYTNAYRVVYALSRVAK